MPRSSPITIHGSPIIDPNMAVNLHAPDPKSLFAVAGIELGWAEAGIRKVGRKDLLVVRIADGASVAGVFTQNHFAAAPVLVCREHLAVGIVACVRWWSTPVTRTRAPASRGS